MLKTVFDNLLKIKSDIFSEEIDIPFRDESWLSIAYDRHKYDNTRLSESDFRLLMKAIGDRERRCIICGSMLKAAAGKKVPITCEEIPLSWDSYRDFLLSDDNYSPEFFVFSRSGNWAIWTDMEITVLGGDATVMCQIIESMGGVDSAFQRMLDEFGIVKGYAETDFFNYLKGLLKL